MRATLRPPALAGRWSVGVPVLAGAAFVAALAVLPSISDDAVYRNLLVSWAVWALAGIGLNIAYGYSGQLSVAHAGLMAVGSYSAAIAFRDHGWGYFPALVLGAILAGILGVLLSLSTTRLTGLHFAIVTLLGGEGIRLLFQNMRDPFGGVIGITLVRSPDSLPFGSLRTQTGLYHLFLVSVLVGLVISWSIRRSRLGDGALAVREAEHLAPAYGVNRRRVKATVMGVSGALAGAAGVNLIYQLQHVEPTLFSTQQNIEILLMVVIGGVASLIGPLVGAAIVLALPTVLGLEASYRFVGVGVALILIMRVAPGGIVELASPLVARLRGPVAAPSPAVVAAVGAAGRHAPPTTVARPSDGALLLEAVALDKAFGGNQVLRKVDLQVAAGEIVGIVGPNGSGKTTLVNCLTGFLVVDAGIIRWQGEGARVRGPEQQAARGIRRSFQGHEVFSNLTVEYNLRIALHRVADGDGAGIAAQVRSAAEGLGFALTERAADLALGQRQQLSLVMCAVARPALIVLDEPAAGLEEHEIDRLIDEVRRLRASGISFVIVDHRLEFLLNVVDRTVCLIAGAVVFEGTPDELVVDDQFRREYLGLM